MESLLSPRRMRDLTERLSDIILLNFYWFICSIPIVTIGASSTALYRAVYLMLREEGSTTKNYFSAFCSNFCKASAVWCGTLLLAAVFYFNYRLLVLTAPAMVHFYRIIAVSIGILIMFLLQFTFPLLAQYQDTIGQTMKNAALLAARHFPITLILCALSSLPFLCAVFVPHWLFQYGIVWMVLGVCMIEICRVKLIQRIFSQYTSSK